MQQLNKWLEQTKFTLTLNKEKIVLSKAGTNLGK